MIKKNKKSINVLIQTDLKCHHRNKTVFAYHMCIKFNSHTSIKMCFFMLLTIEAT